MLFISVVAYTFNLLFGYFDISSIISTNDFELARYFCFTFHLLSFDAYCLGLFFPSGFFCWLWAPKIVCALFPASDPFAIIRHARFGLYGVCTFLSHPSRAFPFLDGAYVICVCPHAFFLEFYGFPTLTRIQIWGLVGSLKRLMSLWFGKGAAEIAYAILHIVSKRKCQKRISKQKFIAT